MPCLPIQRTISTSRLVTCGPRARGISQALLGTTCTGSPRAGNVTAAIKDDCPQLLFILFFSSCGVSVADLFSLLFSSPVGPAASFLLFCFFFSSLQNCVSVSFSDCFCPAAPASTDTKNSAPHPSRTSITMCGWGAGQKGVQSIRGRGGGADRETGAFGGGRTHSNPVQSTLIVDWTPFGCLAGAGLTPLGGPLYCLRTSF